MKLTANNIVAFYNLHKSGTTVKACSEKLGFSKVTLYGLQKQMIAQGIDPRSEHQGLEEIIEEAKKKLKLK